MREYKKKMTVPNKNRDGKRASTKKRKKEVGKIKARSLSRTRTNMIELVENNEDAFISFITLTYKDEIEDIDRAYKDLSNYLKLCKRYMKEEGKELQYIAVPEIQRKRATKTGKYVIHFHLITNIEIGSVLIEKRPAKTIEGADHKGIKTIEYYDLKGWNKGFSIAMPIQNQGDFELSKYLLKYLYKDFSDRFFGRQKILHSNNLKVPEFQYYLEEEEIESIKEKNKNNITEVFSMSEYETENPFIDYVYKKPVD